MFLKHLNVHSVIYVSLDTQSTYTKNIETITMIDTHIECQLFMSVSLGYSCGSRHCDALLAS